MALSSNQILDGLHPWLAERLRYMGQWIDSVGGGQRLVSGLRSREKQEELFRTPSPFPVAVPGCSQHEYGFAADVFWLPIFDFGSNIQLTAKQTEDLMMELGRRLGLVTVREDANHFQVYPGSEFRNWAVSWGLCDPTRTRITTQDLRAADPSVALFGKFCTTFTCNLFGCTCRDPFPFPDE